MISRSAVLILAVGGALALGLLVGGAPLSPSAIGAALLHPHGSGDAVAIIWSLRLPRVAIGAVVGGSLAISGFLLQGMLRNPLVDPFLTGVSAGAGAAIALGVAFGAATAALPAIGFAAGLATALLVAALARRGSGLDAERLILAGVSLSALFASIVSLVLTRLAGGGSAEVLAWLAGTLAGRGWSELGWTLPYVFGGLGLALLCVPALGALRLGTNVAASLGVDVARTQWLILGASTLLAAAAVTLSGIIGFVGLIVPHVARRLVGTDPRLAVPTSAALGAALVIAADAASRALFPPLEIPLGVLLAVIGVPAFLYLYLHPTGSARLWGT
jgi:iron complex transport system permease protein